MASIVITNAIIAIAVANVSFACKLECNGQYVDPAEIMATFPDAYWIQSWKDNRVRGSWSQIVAIDNSGSSAAQTYQQSYTVGFSSTESTTTASTWSVKASAAFQGASIEAGYSSTLTKYKSNTWDEASTTTFTIDVPAYGQADIQQRIIQADMVWTDEVCAPYATKKGKLKYICYRPYGSSMSIRKTYNGKSETCGTCYYGARFTQATVGFTTNCYVNAINVTDIEASCPVYPPILNPSPLNPSPESVGSVKTQYYDNVQAPAFLPSVDDSDIDPPGRRSVGFA
eukprot:CFRG8627T1